MLDYRGEGRNENQIRAGKNDEYTARLGLDGNPTAKSH